MKHRVKLSLAAIAATAMFGSISLNSTPAKAQTEPFIGQLMVFGGTFCPRGWTDAAGQLLPIASNTALFSLYGCTYGGDCRTTMGLPDLRGRSVVGVGTGPGLPTATLGQKGGSTQFTLTTSQLPSHNHSANANQTAADNQNPSGDTLGAALLYNKSAPNVAMNSNTIGYTGGSQAVNKRSPMQVIRYCVALQGIFPSRN